MPGGTSLVLPHLPFVALEGGEGEQAMFTIIITQGTVLHLKKEGQEAPNQGRGGGEASVTSGLLPGPSNAEHEMTSNTEIVGGTEASSREVPGGTTITTPFGVRSTVTVPTKTSLMVSWRAAWARCKPARRHANHIPNLRTQREV